MNRQEMFDTALAGLRKQGKKSLIPFKVGDKLVCAYRGNDDCKCAIGHIIPDANYTPHIENKNAYSIAVHAVIIGKPDTSEEAKVHLYEHADFLVCMQNRMHDSLDNTDFSFELEAGACRVAAAFDLTYSSTGAPV